jgi:hypothetical protein
MALKLRRGTEAQRVITPAQGELLFTTDTKKVYVGDGATVGGILVGPATLSTEATPELGGDLNLNGNDIIGTGNININGTITATGSINLGNGLEDNVNVGGLISSSLNPSVDDEFNLGTVSRQWSAVWATQVNVDTTLTVGSRIVKQTSNSIDSSNVLWEAETDTVNAKEFVGDLSGSVFSDDSAILLDAVNGKLLADVDNTNVTCLNLIGSVVRLRGENELSVPAGLIIETEGTDDDPYDYFTLKGASNTSGSPAALFTRSRGTLAAPAPLQAGDKLLSQYWLGTDTDVNLIPAAGIQVVVDGAPSSGVVAGKIEFATTDEFGSFNVGLSLDKNGVLGILDNSLTAGGASGQVNTSGTIKYIKINIEGTDYALPLYPLNP